MLEQAAKAALEQIDSLSSWLEFQRAHSDVKVCQAGASPSSLSPRSLQLPTWFLHTPTSSTTRWPNNLRKISHNFCSSQGFGRSSSREICSIRQGPDRAKSHSVALLTRQRLVPAGIRSGPVGQRTELALIEQEIAKKKRHIPIRQLIRRAGGALQALKPCFMMGPLSVAQYLAPGHLKFDLVVMDEASQLKPEDALER